MKEEEARPLLRRDEIESIKSDAEEAIKTILDNVEKMTGCACAELGLKVDENEDYDFYVQLSLEIRHKDR